MINIAIYIIEWIQISFNEVDDRGRSCNGKKREERLIGTFAEGGDSESGHKGGNKAKRVRTTFTEEQLSVLQANFQLDSNPDGQDLERIAHVTGLSKRVTQVWFQNSRARQKKHLHTGKMKGQHGKLHFAW